MRVVVVKNQAGARNLKARLIPDSVGADERPRWEARLKAANPHLDLDRLDKDAVVVVPDDLEADLPGADGDEVRLVVTPRLDAQAGPMQARVQAFSERLGEEREVVRRDLRSRAVKEAADADPALAAKLDAARERLTSEAREVREAEAGLRSLIERATADLADLERRFG